MALVTIKKEKNLLPTSLKVSSLLAKQLHPTVENVSTYTGYYTVETNTELWKKVHQSFDFSI